MMKKISFVLAGILLTSSIHAQSDRGRRPTMDSAEMRKMEIQHLKEADLGLSEIQIDSVIAINQDVRNVMHDTEAKKSKERKEQRKQMESYKLARLKLALGDEKLAAKVAEFEKNNPQGGGRPDRQGPPEGNGDMPPRDAMDF